MKKLTHEQYAMKMVTKMRSDLRLSDEQINAAINAMTQALERVSHCHVHVDDGAEPKVYELPDARAFAQSVAAVDQHLLVGLAQYETRGMRKFALFSSAHASMLSALPGRDA
jgi:hypothetical protein